VVFFPQITLINAEKTNPQRPLRKFSAFSAVNKEEEFKRRDALSEDAKNAE
jgi:hypothetical protein